MARILRVNITDRSVVYQDVPSKYKLLADRALTTAVVCDEVDPACHPLGPNNKIVIAPGIATGTNASTSGRLSVGAKSPLTGGIKESNAGTPFGQTIAKLAVKAIIIEGTPHDDSWTGLFLTKDGPTFFDADEYAFESGGDHSLHEVFIVGEIDGGLRVERKRVASFGHPGGDGGKQFVLEEGLISDEIIVDEEYIASPAMKVEALQFRYYLGGRLGPHLPAEQICNIAEIAAERTAS